MDARTPKPRTPFRGPAALALGVCGGLACLGGCAPSPVSADAPRSPYERYDDLRGREVPRTTIDSFGRERLNLEGRLARPNP